MSVQVMAWALEFQDLPLDARSGRPSSTCKLVLLALANHADRNGADCYPSVETICWYTGLSERMVQYCLRTLEEHGTIRKTPHPLLRDVKIHDPRLRPQSYDIVAFGAGAKSGVQSLVRGAKSKIDSPDQGCKLDNDFAPEPSLNLLGVTSCGSSQVGNSATGEPKPLASRPKDAPPDPLFEEFWRIYPRKVKKKLALHSWLKIVKVHDPQDVIVGAARYAASRIGEDPQFTAHPSSWLNAERWNDEPPPKYEPSTVDSRPSATAVALAGVDAAFAKTAMSNGLSRFRGELQ